MRLTFYWGEHRPRTRMTWGDPSKRRLTMGFIQVYTSKIIQVPSLGPDLSIPAGVNKGKTKEHTGTMTIGIVNHGFAVKSIADLASDIHT